MEKNRQQDAVPKKNDFSALCQCNGETQHRVCCCAHKGGSGCKNACCTNGSGNLNRSEE